MPRGQLLMREERPPHVSVSGLTKQGCGLDSGRAALCVFMSKCGGRRSTRWTRDAPGFLQLASRPPPGPPPLCPGWRPVHQIGPAWHACLALVDRLHVFSCTLERMIKKPLT